MHRETSARTSSTNAGPMKRAKSLRAFSPRSSRAGIVSTLRPFLLISRLRLTYCSGRKSFLHTRSCYPAMSYQTLEDKLRAVGNPVRMLRNSQIGPYAFPVVRAEFTNWRDEQRSWRETCALFDQSHHMTDLYVEGPDALTLFSNLGVNSFKTFKVNQAKQFVACNQEGFVIGDAILFYLDENKFNLVGRPSAANWV